MALTHLLDTSVYSQPLRDQPHEIVLQRWSSLDENAIAISALVHAELMQGLRARNSKKFWTRYHELLDGCYPILPFDRMVADTYAGLVVELQNAGRPKPAIDLMIAATALHHGLILVTLNIKDFDGIPGLSTACWCD